MKQNIERLDYVLVSDVSDNSMLYYYSGYYVESTIMHIPMNTTKYVEALKIPYAEEAQTLCDKMNAQIKNPFKYHVEEHMYM